MALFAAEMMTENAEAAPIPRKVVYTAYVYWCEDTGRGKMNATNFYRGIERIPFVESNRVAADGCSRVSILTRQAPASDTDASDRLVTAPEALSVTRKGW